MAAPHLIRPAPPPQHTERNRRRAGGAAMIALGAVATCMVLQQRINPARPDMAGGPYRATIAPDGSVQLGPPARAFHRGEAFGWAGSFCVPPQTAMLLQARLVNLADNRVLLYRERDVPADARGCGSASWDIALPPDTPPGHYQLQRALLLTPSAAAPSTRTLPPLAVEVLP